MPDSHLGFSILERASALTTSVLWPLLTTSYSDSLIFYLTLILTGKLTENKHILIYSKDLGNSYRG